MPEPENKIYQEELKNWSDEDLRMALESGVGAKNIYIQAEIKIRKKEKGQKTILTGGR